MNDLNIKVLDWFDDLPDTHVQLLVSEWAAAKRTLASEITPDPGPWSNDRAPYLTEIMDCFSISSMVQEVAIMKGTQGGFTTGILENAIGYVMDCAPGPTMFVSADHNLIKIGVEVKIDRMIQSVDGLAEKIRPAVEKNHKKSTGDTLARKDFPGGFLAAVSAGSAGSLRSITIKNLYCDEIDGFPLEVGKEGDPLSIVTQRTKNFDNVRKHLYISTPVLLENSRIHEKYLLGDKRDYYIPCPRCNHYQILKFFIDKKTDAGIHFDRDKHGRVRPNSVFYKCCSCSRRILNAEKVSFLLKGEWRPAEGHKALHKNFRSYHWSSIYSPWYSWESMVNSFLITKDNPSKLRAFFNTELGLPWEERGVKPSYDKIRNNRRHYKSKTVPNSIAIEDTGGPVLLVIASIDTQDNGFWFKATGYCDYGTTFDIEWDFIKGNTLKDVDVYEKLRRKVEDTVYLSDDGKEYYIEFAVIDAGGHATQNVYAHCLSYPTVVLVPIMGEQSIAHGTKQVPWRKQKEKENYPGLAVFDINTLLYKNTIANQLNLDWDSANKEKQPRGFKNFPEDYRDDYFKQYTTEHLVHERHPKTGQVYRTFWKHTSGDNHAWDCEVYNSFALALYAYATCVRDFGEEGIIWDKFWDWLSGRSGNGKPPLPQ